MVMARCISFDSYIKPQLITHYWRLPLSCISFDSYIKPQQIDVTRRLGCVVYLLTPTSNHNHILRGVIADRLYIFWLLHQTTTLHLSVYPCQLLYIFWLLHQTTTSRQTISNYIGCISFDFYIKPQHNACHLSFPNVVYLLTPTSNHNSISGMMSHNLLYIFWLLHQTTTHWAIPLPVYCCISFDSYIKPQRLWKYLFSINVVYLLTPTSNHNIRIGWMITHQLYIFWLLHQTTTYRRSGGNNL